MVSFFINKNLTNKQKKRKKDSQLLDDNSIHVCIYIYIIQFPKQHNNIRNSAARTIILRNNV